MIKVLIKTMGDEGEFYFSGKTNCKFCDSFLEEFFQCKNCYNQLCEECIKKNEGKNCPICKTSDFEVEKNEKMNRLLKNIILICKNCNEKFNTSLELSNHICVNKTLKCKYCGFNTKDENQFLEHIKDYHKSILFKTMAEE